MHYHADLEWVRTAFRNFSRTVVSRGNEGSGSRAELQSEFHLDLCRCIADRAEFADENRSRRFDLVQRHLKCVAGPFYGFLKPVTAFEGSPRIWLIDLCNNAAAILQREFDEASHAASCDVAAGLPLLLSAEHT